jgi:hypothetical protein
VGLGSDHTGLRARRFSDVLPDPSSDSEGLAN